MYSYEVFKPIHESRCKGCRHIVEVDLSKVPRSVLLRALEMGGGSASSAPAKKTKKRSRGGVDKRMYKFVGDLKGGVKLYKRPSRNRVYMLTKKGEPFEFSARLMMGRKMLAKVNPGSVQGAASAEFQLDTKGEAALLSAKANGGLGKVELKR